MKNRKISVKLSVTSALLFFSGIASASNLPTYGYDTLQNNQSINIPDILSLAQEENIDLNGYTLNLSGSGTVSNQELQIFGSGTINNTGTISLSNGSIYIDGFSYPSYNQSGRYINGNIGSLNIGNDSVAYIQNINTGATNISVTSGGQLEIFESDINGATITTNAGGLSDIYNSNLNNVNINVIGNNSSLSKLITPSKNGSNVSFNILKNLNNAGFVSTSGDQISGNITINDGGYISDHGSKISGNINNNYGIFSPTNTTISGDYTQSENSFMDVGIIGAGIPNSPFTAPSTVENKPFLTVNGTANLNGTLVINAITGISLLGTEPITAKFENGSNYTIVQAKKINGLFTNGILIVGNYNDSQVSSQVDGLTPYLNYSTNSVQFWLCNGSYCGPGSAIPFDVLSPGYVSQIASQQTAVQVSKASGANFISSTTAVVNNIIGGAPRGSWVKAIGNFGHFSGQQTSGYGATIGYGFHTHNSDGSWTMGPAFSYAYNTVGDSSNGVDTHSYGFWLYGGWKQKGWKVTALAGGGFSSNLGTVSPLGIGTGYNYDGSFYDIAARPGYWFHIGPSFIVSPRLTFNWGLYKSAGFSSAFLSGVPPLTVTGESASIFTTSPAVLVGDRLNIGGVRVFPQVRIGLNENIGPTRNFGLPHTQGTAEARVNIQETQRLHSVLSWKHIYGGGAGYGYNTIVASVKYRW